MKCNEIILLSRPKGSVTLEHFQVKQVDVEDALEEGEALVQIIWLSVDPYLRTRMNEPEHGLCMPAFEIGKKLVVTKPIETVAVAKVVASADPNFKIGDFVTNMFPVREFSKLTQGKVPSGYPSTKVDGHDFSVSNYLGALGMTSFTAWIGIELIAQIKPGEQVFISAASGAVGIAAGQIAKSKGCRVVGSAGSDEKVRFLKEEIDYDEAFNYKAEPDWDATLKRLFPEGIDVYFDNVGGRMLDVVLSHMNQHGRIPTCGMISQYNKEPGEREGVHNMMKFVGKELTMKGFLVRSYNNKHPDFLSCLLPLIKQGKFKYRETVTRGIDNFGAAIIGMLEGDNIGKTLVHVVDP